MRKVLIAFSLLVVTACTSTSSRSAPAGRQGDISMAGGASSAKAAVEGFLAAAKNQDLQRMSTLWGTEKGLAREQMSRDDLEKRLVIMQCSLAHDSWSFTGKSQLQRSNREEDLAIELHLKNLKAQTVVSAVQGVSNRWYVKNVDLTPLKDFCR